MATDEAQYWRSYFYNTLYDECIKYISIKLCKIYTYYVFICYTINYRVVIRKLQIYYTIINL